MKDDANSPDYVAEYSQFDWGDYIKGTKEQIQRLGLGLGRAFPGEAGGPRRQLHVRDCRNYPVRISRCFDREEHFNAFVHFPNWPKSPHDSAIEAWREEQSGLKSRASLWGNEYKGSAAALIAAGLVLAEQLPGSPGQKRTSVTILPMGTIVNGNHRDAKIPGTKSIERISSATYRVVVLVSSEEAERRLGEHRLAMEQWSMRVRCLPRPAMLKPMGVGADLNLTHPAD